MAINFCNPAFSTSVSCSSVSADGYEPANLLKPGAFGLWKGFLAENFIKPPINITFTFPFEIDVCCIVLDPNVGSQRSSGVEIFSAQLPKEETSSMGTSSQQDMSKDIAGSSEVSTNIGKGYCDNVSPRLILFKNRMYRSWLGKDLPPAPLHIADDPDVLTRDFRCPSPWCVRSVNRVVVRITRAQGGSVPALRRVEIWGQPASSCERPLVQKILETARHLQGLGTKKQVRGSTRGPHHTSSKPTKKDVKNVTGGASSSGDIGNVSPAECPEEFLDPITCSMMVIPILLPSGHTIDKETLEKHQDIEATWGRPPNDPFTWVPFSQTSKPIPNVKLKVRIDKFLLTGGAAFQNMPRTAESSDGQEAERTSKAKMRTSILVKPGQVEIHDLNQITANKRGVTSDCQPIDRRGNKNQLVHGGPSKKRQYPEPCAMKQQGTASKKCRFSDVKDSSLSKHTQSTPSNGEGGHEKMVSDSLDDALASTLASLPSYSKPGKTKPEDTKATDSCINCASSTQDSDANIYSMPCGHFICRKCTTQMSNKIRCQRCKRDYKTADLSRVHTR